MLDPDPVVESVLVDPVVGSELEPLDDPELDPDPVDEPDPDPEVELPELPWRWCRPPDPRLPPRPVWVPLLDALQVFPADPVPVPVVLVLGTMVPGSPTRMCTGAVVVVEDPHLVPVDVEPDPCLVELPVWFVPVSVAW